MIRSYLTDLYSEEIHLLELGLNRIGRGPRVEIEVQAFGVSRTHCALVSDAAGRVLLNDLGSKNGTKVDDLHTLGTQNVTPGQIIQVGALRFLLGQVDLSRPAEQRALLMSTRVFEALVAERRQSA